MIQFTEPVHVFTQAELVGIINEAAAKAAQEVIKRLPGIGQANRPSQVTKKDAAEMLGVSPPTVTAYIRAGKLTLNSAGKIPVGQIDKLAAGKA